MSRLRNLAYCMTMVFSAGLCGACSSGDTPPSPTPTPPKEGYHFDLWVALDRHGGMGRNVQTLVRSLSSLDADQPMITFEGTGTEVNATLSLETIVKGAYYYQVPVSGDRFAKYTITDNKIQVVASQRFVTNTYSTRKYTHAWLDDNTLLIMAASGDQKSIIWTKLNTADMSIISEGTLNVALPEGANVFTTSGIATYRPADGKLFYFYYGKGKVQGGQNTRTTPFYTAVIKAADMSVIESNECPLDCEMTGSAYGELLQKCSFVADNGDLYLACYGDTDAGEKSYLLKIPAGSTKFDMTYNGFPQSGKLLALEYLGGDKVLAYARDDSKGVSIDSYSHYYTVINVKTITSQALEYDGASLPFSNGRFSTRMAVAYGKAYIGTNPENANPRIYIYDIASGKLTLGAEMKEGYYFEQIRVLDNVAQ